MSRYHDKIKVANELPPAYKVGDFMSMIFYDLVTKSEYLELIRDIVDPYRYEMLEDEMPEDSIKKSLIANYYGIITKLNHDRTLFEIALSNSVRYVIDLDMFDNVEVRYLADNSSFLKENSDNKKVMLPLMKRNQRGEREYVFIDNPLFKE